MSRPKWKPKEWAPKRGEEVRHPIAREAKPGKDARLKGGARWVHLGEARSIEGEWRVVKRCGGELYRAFVRSDLRKKGKPYVFWKCRECASAWGSRSWLVWESEEYDYEGEKRQYLEDKRNKKLGETGPALPTYAEQQKLLEEWKRKYTLLCEELVEVTDRLRAKLGVSR
jgi:hypothetical protein